MFPKQLRLSANTKLENVKNFHSPLFVLKIAKNSLTHNRYGFIVSKKVDARASARNRIKRQIRSVFEKLNTNLEQGKDFLIIIKKEAVGKTTEEFFIQIESTLKNLIIKN